MHETYLPLDAQEMLARFDREEIPASWRVFRTNRKQLIRLIIGFCTTVFLIVGFLMLYLLTNFDHHPPVPSDVLYIVGIIQLFFLLFTAIISISMWITMKDIVYIFTPICLIRRNYNKQKRIFSVNYRDIVEIRGAWNVVIVEIEGKRQRKTLHCQFLEPPADEALFTFEKMYEAFQSREAELTLKPKTLSARTDESSPDKIQPPPSRRTTHSIPIIIFLSGFLLYAGGLLVSARHHLPSNFLAWTAWTVACITCFLLTEGPILLLAIALGKRAERLFSDERLSAEPETMQTRRLLRRAIFFWQAHYFLSLPVFTFIVPLWVMILCQPLQLWLESQVQATGHGNYLVLLVLTLICLLNSLALIPFIQVHRWFVNAVHPIYDHQDETHIAS